MNPAHHHHHHPGISLGPLPIGMVAAHGAGMFLGGPVGIGIGVPIMAAASIAQHPPQQQKKMVSPDSSDDGKDKCISHSLNHRPPSPISPHTSHGPSPNHLNWPNPMLSNMPGMSYPVMGMGIPPPLIEPNMLYGIISAVNGADLNHSHGHSIVNLPNPTTNPTLTIPTIPNTTTPTAGSPGMTVGVSPGTAIHNLPPQPQQTKEIIHCKSCTLFPPNPSAPPPTTREIPPGCRTVFVGGLPENVTDEIIREIFERCGEITTIRMSKKNFCHIRFELDSYVEHAIYLSGYRVRIGSNSDAANIGRLHVDYAQARDDLYEWECRQRQLMREQRHRVRIEQERLLPPSPPPVVHYSEHEALNVAEKLKDESFIKAVQVLITWLDRGDCVKRNSNTFYSMIQSTNSHVRRLLNEKAQYEEELQKAKDLMQQRMQGLLMQFSQIEKVFIAACHKKVWDHFTKAQRKNIDSWRKQAGEIKNIQLEEALNERNDEEMDLSDVDSENDNNGSSSAKKRRIDDDKTVNQLKEENDALRCQLEASKNEVDMIKVDLKTEFEVKDHQIRILQQQLKETGRSPNKRLQNGDSKLAPENLNNTGTTTNTKENTSKYSLLTNGEITAKTKEIVDNCDSSSSVRAMQNNQVVIDQGGPDELKINDIEARLIAIISTFLHVHPFGASLDYIWSYAQKVIPTVRPNQLEALLYKFPSLFKQELSGVGATLERKWIFVGFS